MIVPQCTENNTTYYCYCIYYILVQCAQCTEYNGFGIGARHKQAVVQSSIYMQIFFGIC